ncbi:hypothetical protein QFC22_006279 [Naganishia vaughanmartiniae]|uniref:Uncharacterized protein n=1 Tax=Naganishia vaughanmartiniae TaxID=1424756 RepID=A0ACC2WLL5_9TREE|nr:hypothetical protein QFC22_006279 [Naganishia vaughanmartiniae]
MSKQPDTQTTDPIVAIAADWNVPEETYQQLRAPYEVPSKFPLQDLIEGIQSVEEQVKSLLREDSNLEPGYKAQFESLEKDSGDLYSYLQKLKVVDGERLDARPATRSSCWLALSMLEGALKLVETSQTRPEGDSATRIRLSILQKFIKSLQESLRHVGHTPRKPLLQWRCDVYKLQDLPEKEVDPQSVETHQWLKTQGEEVARITLTYQNPGTGVMSQRQTDLPLSLAGDFVASLGSDFAVDSQMKDRETAPDPEFTAFSQPASVASNRSSVETSGGGGARSVLSLDAIKETGSSDGSEAETVVPDRDSDHPSL